MAQGGLHTIQIYYKNKNVFIYTTKLIDFIEFSGCKQMKLICEL